jgi:cytidine deaminase
METEEQYAKRCQENLHKTAFQGCEWMQNRAMAFLSGKKIGACIAGLSKEGYTPKLFYGFNIELSFTHCYHAEEVAMINCLSDGHRPIIIFVTSKSFEEMIALCGDCRQKLMNANRDIRVVVFNPDGSIKIDEQVKEITKYSKSNGKINWESFWMDWDFQQQKDIAIKIPKKVDKQ